MVKNPNGALLNVQLSLTDTQGWTRIVGKLTSQSAFEIPLPAAASKGDWSLRATATDAAGKVLEEKSWKLPSQPQFESEASQFVGLRAWPTPPFAAFAETRLAPLTDEIKSGATNQVAIENLYRDEADQGAFIVASTRDEPTRARVALTRLARSDGAAFDGTIVLREVLATGSVNGEKVPDALPTLGDAGLITIPAHRSVKIWISVDARGAQPGNYTGQVSIASVNSDVKKIELPVNLKVLNLRLPKEFPLTLGTWDYVPNRWFPSRSKEVLDDMARHGVNVFPRTTIPPGRVDGAGKLTIDWPVLDAELDRLDHCGKILFHLNHPPIESAVQRAEQEKRTIELEDIRNLRDHLRERGWGYADYAFYLLDEPGLDNGPNIPILLDAGHLFREADPKLLTYTDPVAGLSWKDFERIEPLVDVWAPNMRLVSGLLSGDPRIRRIMNAKTVWSYECISQVKSLSPLCYNRANAWRAKFFGLSGIGFWTHSTTEADIWFAGKGINDEYALVYPGELPVPSVRWEAVRDGMEDVAAIALLENQIQRHRQGGTRRELVPQAEQALRIALRDVMELSDEPFVESRDFLRAGDRVLGHTWTDLETFHRHRAEIAQLTLALAAE
ncbi:MAG: glycoside hydrolase domain-containing protein [Verrucomicrobiota bacterium]